VKFNKTLFVIFTFAATTWGGAFLEEYPHLKEHIRQEPKSNVWVGIGLSPISILPSKVLHTFSPFQMHWTPSYFDWELIHSSVGFTSIVKESYSGSLHFIFRTCPKLRFGFLSFGPLAGYEFITFPGIQAKLTDGVSETGFDTFSVKGPIFGGQISETMLLGNFLLKFSQTYYKQFYSVTRTTNGWTYQFSDAAVSSDAGRLATQASDVFMFDVSILF
jgi:hypothetical protein